MQKKRDDHSSDERKLIFTSHRIMINDEISAAAASAADGQNTVL